MRSANDKTRICLGAFAGAHGVKGDAKLKTFTETPKSIAAYGPVESEDGARIFTLTFIRELKPGLVLVRAPEIKSREDADSMKGVRLYVDREKLPAPDENEFYLDDLIGLQVIDETGAAMGAVSAIYDFGAGDLIEIKDIPEINGVRLVQFTKEAVPEINLAKRIITVLRSAIDIGDDTEPADADDPPAAADSGSTDR